MANWNQTLRIRGEQLGVSDSFVDVTITNYSLNGAVKLVEDVETNPREFTVSASDLDEWSENSTLAPRGEITDPDNDIWSLIDQLQSHIDDDALAPVEGELRELVDKLYRLTTKGQRSVGPPENAGPPENTGPPGGN